MTTEAERVFRVYRPLPDGGAIAIHSGLLTLDEARAVRDTRPGTYIGRMPPLDKPLDPIVRVDD